MEQFSKEEIEFAKFASGVFAEWGHQNLTRVMTKAMTHKQYIHEMLLLVLAQFQGDAEKCWRFLRYALDDSTYNDCVEYVVFVHQQEAEETQ